MGKGAGIKSEGEWMMEFDFVKADTKQYLELVEELYMEAFPAVERKPFSMLVKAQEKGNAEILMIRQRDGGGMLGEVVLARHAGVVLLDYFAIAPAFRGHGIGTKVLGELKKRCEGERLVLEIESTQVEADNLKQRLSRKAFYGHCGMETMDYSVMVMGVVMEVLTFGDEVGFAEYHAVYEEVFGKEVGGKVWLVG